MRRPTSSAIMCFVPIHRVIAGYRVEHALGSGGFATVFLVRREGSTSPLALKLLAENWSMNADVRQRFASEARTLQRLAGRGVVRVHEVGVAAGDQPYFVMDYADLGTLEQQLALVGGRASDDDVILTIAEIALGVSRAHEQGVVHRDLKPANVLLRTTQESERGHEVLLADFGLARSLVEASRLTTAAMGTPVYMAPEQYDQRADRRCDVYALGVLTFQMFSGHLPFAHADPGLLLRAKRTESYTSFYSLRPDLPPGLARLIHRSLSADPNDRPENASAWLQEVISALTDGNGSEVQQPNRVDQPAPPMPTTPLKASPYARVVAMNQLRTWVEMVRAGTLTHAEYAQAKARKLAEVGLTAHQPRAPGVHVSPYGQLLAMQQANEFRSLVEEGVLTPSEYEAARAAILRDQGLID